MPADPDPGRDLLTHITAPQHSSHGQESIAIAVRLRDAANAEGTWHGLAAFPTTCRSTSSAGFGSVLVVGPAGVCPAGGQDPADVGPVGAVVVA
ncbi:hypothetical protein [Nocardia sp. NPDC046763]|uniref:hypothetical protein n=1 Tax=Nocardia sp. NPDC046763 TaxID=3155256 RepID=UPI0033F343CB